MTKQEIDKKIQSGKLPVDFHRQIKNKWDDLKYDEHQIEKFDAWLNGYKDA